MFYCVLKKTSSTSKDFLLNETLEQPSAGPYTPANDTNHGKVIREERVEQIYCIIGNGNDKVPSVDPLDAVSVNY